MRSMASGPSTASPINLDVRKRAQQARQPRPRRLLVVDDEHADHDAGASCVEAPLGAGAAMRTSLAGRGDLTLDERQRETHVRAAALASPGERGAIAEVAGEPLLQAAQAEAAAGARRRQTPHGRGRHEAGAGIGDVDDEGRLLRPTPTRRWRRGRAPAATPCLTAFSTSVCSASAGT